MLIILTRQFLQFVLISFGTSVNSFHTDGLLYTSSAAETLTKEKTQCKMTDSPLFFRQTHLKLNSHLNIPWIYLIRGKLLSRKLRLWAVWANRRDFSRDLRPVSSSPRVSLRAGISCLGPASTAPHFNQALGSEIWARRAGCTRAPFIWFQSSLRPRMWPRGHSFSRHWGGGSW